MTRISRPAGPSAAIAFLFLAAFQTGWAQGHSSSLPSVPHANSERPEEDYCTGPDDLLSVTVLEAPELSRSVRVSARGEISLPLIGVFQVGGLTPRAIELQLEDHLRRTYMRDPHVSVQVQEMQSHSISVMGAVRKPGTFQVRGARSLLAVLSLAEGLAEDAGSTAIVMRGGTASEAEIQSRTPDSGGAGPAPRVPGDSASNGVVEVQLKDLLATRDPEQNVLVYPGDVVKVMPAGMIYIVGEVNKPGAFPMNEHERLTVLRAIALGAGLKPTAAEKNTIIIRTLDTGSRVEVPINLDGILKGKVPDVALQARDVVFVPNSSGKSVALGAVDVLTRMVTLRAVVF